MNATLYQVLPAPNKARELANLLVRAAAALATPHDVTSRERAKLIDDLTAVAAAKCRE